MDGLTPWLGLFYGLMLYGMWMLFAYPAFQGMTARSRRIMLILGFIISMVVGIFLATATLKVVLG